MFGGDGGGRGGGGDGVGEGGGGREGTGECEEEEGGAGVGGIGDGGWGRGVGGDWEGVEVGWGGEGVYRVVGCRDAWEGRLWGSIWWSYGLLRKNATGLRTLAFIYSSRIFHDAVGVSQRSLRSSFCVHFGPKPSATSQTQAHGPESSKLVANRIESRVSAEIGTAF